MLPISCFVKPAACSCGAVVGSSSSSMWGSTSSRSRCRAAWSVCPSRPRHACWTAHHTQDTRGLFVVICVLWKREDGQQLPEC